MPLSARPIEVSVSPSGTVPRFLKNSIAGRVDPAQVTLLLTGSIEGIGFTVMMILLLVTTG